MRCMIKNIKACKSLDSFGSFLYHFIHLIENLLQFHIRMAVSAVTQNMLQSNQSTR